MNKIRKIVEFLSGKKTYIAGALMIVLGLIQGDNQMVGEGFGFIFLRQSIAKSEEKSDE